MEEKMRSTADLRTKNDSIHEEEKQSDDIISEEITQEIEQKTDIIPFESLQNKMIFVRVGSEETPAEVSQIENIRETLTNLIERNNVKSMVFVTHHAIDIKIIG